MAAFRWTIKRKLLALGAATLLSLLLVLFLWVQWEVREHTAQGEQELRLTSQQAAAQVEGLIGELTGHLRVLAGHLADHQWQVEHVERLFRQVRSELPWLENVLAVNSEGRVIATAVPQPAGRLITMADQPWFQRVMSTGQPVVGGFQIGRIVGQPVALVAVPLHKGEGLPTGVLGAPLSLRRLHAQFQNLPLASGWTLTVVDGEGRVLTRLPETQGWIGRPLPSAQLLPARSEPVTKLVRFEGEEGIVGVAPVQGTRWRVLVAMPMRSLMFRVWKETQAIGLPLLALLALIGLAGLLIARAVWRPLRALVEGTKQVARGEPALIPARSTDEIGELARSFNAMAAEVVEYRSGLEQRIAELTALSEAGRLLTSTLDLPHVIERLTDLVRTRLCVDMASIWLWDSATETLSPYARSGTTRQGVEGLGRFRRGEGLAGWIIVNRAPLSLPDVQEDRRLSRREWVQAEGIVSYFGVPLFLEDVPIGVLSCWSRTRRVWTPEEERLVELFGLPAAVAIRNASRHEEIRARARDLAEQLAEQATRRHHIHRALRTINVEHDPDRLLQRTAETFRDFFGARYAALALFQEDGRIGQFFTAGLDPQAREQLGPLPEGRGLLGHVFKHGQTLRLDDLMAHPAAVGFPPGHPVMRNLLAKPIPFRGKTLGALYLTDKPGGFTADDEDLLTVLLADITVAIWNAHLMTDLRRALDDLRAAQEQLVRSEALRATGELASGVAHHLNNILTVIGGWIQLLLEEVWEPSHHRSLEIVGGAVARGAEVIRRLQRFSRAQPVAEVVPVDLNRLLQEAVELTRPVWQDQAQRRGVSIETALEPGAVPAVAGDPAALSEMFVNLLLNAVDALPGGGRITIRTWAEAGRVHCAVSDTGVGMSEEGRRRALQPFFTTKGPQNTGLGLSVAHGTIQRHGGELAIESARDRGTSVRISLPAAPDTGGVAPAATAPSPRVTQRKILVIDDDAQVREVLARILTRQGHLVTLAASGAEGVTMFQADHHDLVFADLGMPGMTGWQVAEAIKALSPATPVVLVTGWGDEVEDNERDLQKVDEVVSKPFTPTAIAEVIGKALGGESR